MRNSLLILCVVAAACSSRSAGDSGAQPAQNRSAIVIRGTDSAGGTVLDAMRMRLPSMRVGLNTTCPTIMFRGPQTMGTPGEPSVYVDGARMVNTCILQQISTSDVDRVEVYPSGDTSRPGVQHNRFGVILVYRIRR